jgi:hypothetical protein
MDTESKGKCENGETDGKADGEEDTDVDLHLAVSEDILDARGLSWARGEV